MLKKSSWVYTHCISRMYFGIWFCNSAKDACHSEERNAVKRRGIGGLTHHLYFEQAGRNERTARNPIPSRRSLLGMTTSYKGRCHSEERNAVKRRGILAALEIR